MNLDLIKQKLEGLTKTGNRQKNIWKPKPGKQVVRIVPYKHNRDYPFVEIFFHYEMGGKTYVSPVTNGNPDPIVEFAEKLKSSGLKEDYLLSRKLMPTMRTYVPVVVRGEEDEGVKFWGIGKSVYTELLNIISDPDYGDITDPKSGRDITVEFEKGGENGKQFGNTTIRIKPNTTALHSDINKAKEFISSQPNLLEEVYPEPSYADLKVALENWLAGGGAEPAAEAEEETEQPASDAKSKSAAKPAAVAANKTTSDIDKAFDDLFND